LRNHFLDERTAADIDQRIDRIHRDLGSRDRPIELPQVRELLRLDLRYYTIDDPRFSEEVVHSLRVGAKRIADAPRRLMDAARKFDLRALFLWKPKRILIDSNLHDIKKRWSESHEIAHSLIPWHEDYVLGDDRSTLSPACHEAIEAEANYGAGRLLFPPKAFVDAAMSSPPSMAHVRALSEKFGNSITATLWRFVENHPGHAFGVVSQHPQLPRAGEPTVAYLICSRRVLQEFPVIDADHLFSVMTTYCSRNRGGSLGSGRLVLMNANGDSASFHMESFANGYHALTIGWR
jgi:Zn-dependent peptidase ImmA (M78 family)